MQTFFKRYLWIQLQLQPFASISHCSLQVCLAAVTRAITTTTTTTATSESITRLTGCQGARGVEANGFAPRRHRRIRRAPRLDRLSSLCLCLCQSLSAGWTMRARRVYKVCISCTSPQTALLPVFYTRSKRVYGFYGLGVYIILVCG